MQKNDASAFMQVAPPLTPPPPPPSSLRASRKLNKKVLASGIAVILLLLASLFYALGLARGPSADVPATATAQAERLTAQANATATQANVAATAAATAAALTATAQPNINATATATIIAGNPNPYPPNIGTLALYDPLSSNSSSNWDENSNCQFIGGSYHISENQQGRFYHCSAEATNFSNFAYRVEMKILKGDCGGMIFRANSTAGNYYFFGVCQDGSYFLARYRNNLLEGNLIYKTYSSAIHAGLNQSNVIAVVADNDSINLYVNSHAINSVRDNILTQGSIAVSAGSFNYITEVSYIFAKVWTW